MAAGASTGGLAQAKGGGIVASRPAAKRGIACGRPERRAGHGFVSACAGIPGRHYFSRGYDFAARRYGTTGSAELLLLGRTGAGGGNRSLRSKTAPANAARASSAPRFGVARRWATDSAKRLGRRQLTKRFAGGGKPNLKSSFDKALEKGVKRENEDHAATHANRSKAPRSLLCNQALTRRRFQESSRIGEKVTHSGQEAPRSPGNRCDAPRTAGLGVVPGTAAGLAIPEPMQATEGFP